MPQTPLHIYNDEELMGLLRNGNVNAFDVLYLRYAKRLKHYFYKMLDNDAAMADDFFAGINAKGV